MRTQNRRTMKLSITLFLASLLVFTSCGYKAAEETAAGTQPPTTPAAGQSVTSSDSPVQQVSDVNPITPVQTATTSTGLPATATTSTAGLNPAHGQPGHRCDLAVGAPLNGSKPVTPATKQ